MFVKKMSLIERIPSKASFGQFVPGGLKPLMAMVEVTNRCNMACPVCFSNANHYHSDVPIANIRDYLERLLEITDTPIPLQISGGEPTVRDDLPEIISIAQSLGFQNIELITNGIKISKEFSFLQTLKEKGLTAVYLQFDGLRKETHLRIRGQDLTEVRYRAVKAIKAAGLCCTLAVTVTRGVNDGEVGDIVRFATQNIDVVRAINFQTATRFAGRFEIDNDYKGYGMPELLNLVERQAGIPASTFYSEHIGDPGCNAMGLVFLVNGKMEPLFKYISKEDVFAFLGEEAREKILASFSGKKEFFLRHLLNPNAWKLIAKAAPIIGTNPYNVLRTEHLLLFAKSFMELDSLEPQRINKCQYAITGEKGVFSFCAYNNLYRFSNGNHLEPRTPRA